MVYQHSIIVISDLNIKDSVLIQRFGGGASIIVARWGNSRNLYHEGCMKTVPLLHFVLTSTGILALTSTQSVVTSTGILLLQAFCSKGHVHASPNYFSPRKCHYDINFAPSPPPP